MGCSGIRFSGTLLYTWVESGTVRVKCLPRPGARFLETPETVQPVKLNGEDHAPETACMKRTFVNIKNLRIKQLCKHKYEVLILGSTGQLRTAEKAVFAYRMRKKSWQYFQVRFKLYY